MSQQVLADGVATPREPPDQLHDEPAGPARGPRIRRSMPLLLGTLYTLWAALACDAVLEASLRAEPVWSPGRGALVSVLVMWCAVLLLIGLTGRLHLALAILLPATMVIGAANWTKMSMLREPVVPADTDYVRHPGFLVSMVGTNQIVLGIATALGVAGAVIVVGRLCARRFTLVSRQHPRWRAWVGLRLALILVCSLALIHTGTFNAPGNLWRSAFDAAGVTWADWDQVENYQTNGFIGGFLYNLPAEAEVPAGYGPQVMHEIADRYTRRASRNNQDASAAALGDYNVVVVLSESFSDLSKLQGLELDSDPIPRTREVSRSQWGGEALAAFYGTGTSTMEFQALTGQAASLFDQRITTPYQQLVPTMTDYPSAVGWLEGLGYRTVAIHSYSTELYNRRKVYSVFGFDEFVHDTTMQESEQIEHSPFISDRSAYDEVVHQIDQYDQSVFAHLVTMQNHVPTANWYDDRVGVRGVTGDEADSVGGFARGLSYTDADLPGFLADIRATGEPTVLVFYGDHFPGIFGSGTKAANSDLAMRTTPMFIWSSESEEPRPLPVTNPVGFLPLAMQRIGAPLPPYYELLREVGTEIGALDRTGAVGADGEVTPYASLDDRQQRLLEDLRLVQYDFSLGERYALDEMWYSPTQQLEKR